MITAPPKQKGNFKVNVNLIVVGCIRAVYRSKRTVAIPFYTVKHIVAFPILHFIRNIYPLLTCFIPEWPSDLIRSSTNNCWSISWRATVPMVFWRLNWFSLISLICCNRLASSSYVTSSLMELVGTKDEHANAKKQTYWVYCDITKMKPSTDMKSKWTL